MDKGVVLNFNLQMFLPKPGKQETTGLKGLLYISLLIEQVEFLTCITMKLARKTLSN